MTVYSTFEMRYIDRHREEEFILTPKKRPGPPLPDVVVNGDVATFVTFNRIRPSGSRAGSLPRSSHAVGWPRFLDPKPD